MLGASFASSSAERSRQAFLRMPAWVSDTFSSASPAGRCSYVGDVEK
jgi:hypothetical protein